jgi:hypothetical protein
MAKTNRKSGISGVSERMASAEQSKPTAVVSRPGSTQTSARTQIGDTGADCRQGQTDMATEGLPGRSGPDKLVRS